VVLLAPRQQASYDLRMSNLDGTIDDQTVAHIKVALGIGAIVLTILGYIYKLHRDGLDKPKVRITASGAFAGLPERAHYIVVVLTNSGRRPVTLSSVRFQNAEAHGLLVMHPAIRSSIRPPAFPARGGWRKGSRQKSMFRATSLPKFVHPR